MCASQRLGVFRFCQGKDSSGAQEPRYHLKFSFSMRVFPSREDREFLHQHKTMNILVYSVLIGVLGRSGAWGSCINRKWIACFPAENPSLDLILLPLLPSRSQGRIPTRPWQGGLATDAESSSLLPGPEMAKILRPGFSTHTPTTPLRLCSQGRQAGPSCDVENSMSERPPRRSGSS